VDFEQVDEEIKYAGRIVHGEALGHHVLEEAGHEHKRGQRHRFPDFRTVMAFFLAFPGHALFGPYQGIMLATSPPRSRIIPNLPGSGLVQQSVGT